MQIIHQKSFLYFPAVVVFIAANLVSCHCKNPKISHSSIATVSDKFKPAPPKPAPIQTIPTQDEQAQKAVHEFEKYKQSAEQGEAEAQVALGKMYKAGLGTELNYEKAVESFQQAASQGNRDAIYQLGVMCQQGRGTGNSNQVDNDKRAVELFQAATEKGSLDAQYQLGYMYASGRGVDNGDQVANDKKAIELFQEPANQGEPGAQYNLAVMYELGRIGRPKQAGDDGIVVKWLEKSAEGGFPIAQYQLGFRYVNGHGVPTHDKEKNDAIAVKWFEEAAKQGHVKAQTHLGWMYMHGRGIAQNKLKALECYKKAASQGELDAIAYLASMYEDGNGVPQNLQKSFELYKRAAEAGNLAAQLTMGGRIEEIYKKSGVMPTNEEWADAAKWYRKAMDQGSSDAPYYLGEMYEHGYGMEKNDTKAAEMYLRSAERDFKETVDAADFENRSGLYDVARVYLEERVDGELFEKIFTFLQKGAATSKASENYVVLLLMGLMYERGHGVNQNSQKAEEYLAKAAAQENTRGGELLYKARNYLIK